MATTELIESQAESSVDFLNELKLDIVRRVTEIDDPEAIRDIVLFLRRVAPNRSDIRTPEWTALLNADLEQGRKDYAEGRWVDHDDFMAELDQWLTENRKK